MAEALKQQRALARRMSVDSDAHVKHEAPVFVASEFWDQQPRRAAEQMMARNLPKYIAFFGDGAFTPLEEASDLVSQAAWFKRYIGPFQPIGASDRQQAMDICKVLTYERVERGGELFAKGEQVGAFAVVLSGAVRLSGDPRNREDVIKTGGEAFGEEALAEEKDADCEASASATADCECEVLVLSREAHLWCLGLQEQREMRMRADMLSRIPMLKHYSCHQRTALASAFQHVSFPTDITIVEDAASSRDLYILVEGRISVQKRLRVGGVRSYDLELKVLRAGALFGGDRFGSGLEVFEGLSFSSQGAVECLVLSTDQRLLDTSARSWWSRSSRAIRPRSR